MLEDNELRDKVLKRLSMLSSPPKDLLPSLTFKSTDENPVDLDAKIEEYAPYYKYTRKVKKQRNVMNLGRFKQ